MTDPAQSRPSGDKDKAVPQKKKRKRVSSRISSTKFLRNQFDKRILKVKVEDDCVREEYPDYEKCLPLSEAYDKAAAAWFAKCEFIKIMVVVWEG